jgi:hypothetical protein
MIMDESEITVDWDAIDWERVDQAALALMVLGLQEGWRSWKGFDWQVLNRLYEKGFITDPRSKAKSVTFTKEGIQESRQLFAKLFRRGNMDE